MKFWAALAVVVLPVCLGAGPEPKVMSGIPVPPRVFSGEIRILDWNIDKGKRLEQVASLIRTRKPDLVLIQEVDLNAPRTGRMNITAELARKLGMNWIYGPSFRELGQGTHDEPAYNGQGILTTLPIRSSRILMFEHQSGFWKPQPFLPNWGLLQRRAGGRTALIAEFGGSKTELAVYNLHLESRSGSARFAQLDEVLRDADRYGPDVTVVVAGDLNSKFRKGVYEEKLRNKLFHNCLDIRQRTHRLCCTLDWIVVRGPASCSESSVLRGAKGSDHFPVETKIVLKQR